MGRPLAAWVLCAIAAAAAPARAASVDVSFPHPERYLDAGIVGWDETANLRTLAACLQALGRHHLPAGQALKVEVLEVDLAGTRYSTPRGPIRIARGGADWPRITLRYILLDHGRVLRQGEETVADMNYANHIRDRYASGPLGAEKRMLDRWFRTRFGEPRAHAGG